MMKKRILAILLCLAMVMNIGFTAIGTALAEAVETPPATTVEGDTSQTAEEPETVIADDTGTPAEGDTQDGATGDSEPTGDTAPDGATGDSELTGDTAPDGATGDSEPTGDTAPDGATGDSEPTGDTAPDGATGGTEEGETPAEDAPMLMAAMALDALETPAELACSVTLNKSSLAVGETVTASWAASGGVAPYQYAYTWYITDENGATATTAGTGTDAANSFALQYGVSGHVSVLVTDAEGSECAAESTVFTITGSTAADPLICSIALNKTTVAVGAAITATYTVAGGTAPYSYKVIWHSRTAAGVVTDLYEDTTADTSVFVPVSGVSGNAEVRVTDSLGRSAWFTSGTFAITGSTVPTALTCAFTLDKTTLSIGSAITATWVAAGGKLPYTYTTVWEITEGDGNVIETWGETATAKSVFTPLAGALGKLKVNVSDATGRSAWFESKTFAITGAQVLDPLACAITLDKTTVAVASAITGSWTASGGTAPYTYAATWVVTEANGETQSTAVSGADSTAQFTPSLGAWGYLTVAVRDALGRTGTFQSDVFTVTGASNVPALACAIDVDLLTVPINNAVTASWSITGGKEPYTCSGNWVITEANGNELSNRVESLTGETASFTPIIGVRGRLELEISDADGRSLWVSSPQFAITGAATTADPLTCTITLDKATLAIGTANKAKWVVAGGTAPYTYSTQWIITEANGNEIEQTNDFRTSSNEDSYLPIAGVKGFMRVTVYDALGRTRQFTSAEFAITGAVSSDPLACVIELDETTVAVREAINATWTVSGGTAPYTVDATWYVNETDGKGYSKAIGAATGKASLIPFAGDSGYLSLHVLDSSGHERWFVSDEFTITGSTATKSLACEITLDRETVSVGTQIIANWTVQGGVEPYTYKALWTSVESNGTTVTDETAVTDNYTGFAPKTGVNGYFQLYIVDAVGHNEWFTSDTFAITGATVITPMTGTITLDRNVTAIRTSVKATWAISGGKAPYTFNAQWQITESNGYSYYSNYTVPYIGTTAPTSTTYMPTAGAVGCMRMFVTDADGRKLTLKTNNFSITGALTATRLSFTATLDKTTVYQGLPITVTVTPSGGSTPYTYGYTWVTLDSTGYETVAATTDSSISYTNAFTPTAGEWGYVEVTLKDDAGRQEKWRSDYFEIGPAYAITSIKANKVSAFIGDPITWSVEARGFTTAKQISYMLYNGDALVAVQGFGTASTYTYTPTSAGNYWLMVSVKEGTVTITDDSIDVAVLAPLSITSVTPSATLASTGTMLLWVVGTNGGSGTKQFQYRLSLGGKVINTPAWVNQPTFSYTPMVAGTYTLSVSVRDTTATASKTSPATAVSVPLMVTAVSGTPKLAATGTKLDWTITTTGGSGTKQYYCKVYLGNTVVNTPSWSTTAAYSYTATAVGNYALSVTVRDSTATLVKASSVTRTYVPLAVQTVTADQTDVELGATVTWTVNATGGDGAKTYRYTVMKGTAVVEQTDWLSAATFAYTPTETGSYTVTASVKAGSETQDKTSAATTVRTPDPLTLTSVTPSKTNAAPGDQITWTVNAEHGTGAKLYLYKLYLGATVVNTPTWVSDATCTLTLADAGVYAMRVSVKDSLTTLSKTSAATTVSQPIAITSVTPNSTAAVKGVPLTWTVAVSGGVDGKQYQYKLYNGGTVVNTPAWGTEATFAYTPSEAGNYALSVTVKDASGSTAKNSAVTAVADAVTISAVTPSATSLILGNSLTWTVTANCDNLQYYYRLYKGGTVVNTPAWGTDATFAYTPDAVGSYALSVSVRIGSQGASKASPVTKVYVPLVLESVVAEPSPTVTGTEITWTATATGGEGTKQYLYKLYQGGTVVNSPAWVSESTFAYTPTAAGTYALSVSVKDSMSLTKLTSAKTVVTEP